METILQIGEGVFLRAFAENYIQDAVNEGYEGSVVICQPRKNTAVINALKNRGCRYDIIVRGKLDGRLTDGRLPVSCVSRCIDSCGEYGELQKLFCSAELKIVISNTTESGICFNKADRPENYPDISFPAKVTALLYRRFLSKRDGLVFMPAELIENNGSALRECIIKYAALWKLGGDFVSYVKNECSFCDTLVDRIVTGHIASDEDPCSVACEPYRSWIVSADEKAKAAIPFKNIVYVSDIAPYRARKVKILNGIHTMTAPAALSAGIPTVREAVSDGVFGEYIRRGLEEIKASLDMPKAELDSFADGVLERFSNPFIEHRLIDISLNSVSKFKERCLGTITDYYGKFGVLPKILTFSLAALIAFYLRLPERKYEIKDSEETLAFFAKKPSVEEIMRSETLWGTDLTKIGGFREEAEKRLCEIKENGITNAVKEVLYEQTA